MLGLYPEFSMIWLAKALAQPTRRASQSWLAPFRTLHAIQWSAPWKEVGDCREGCG